MPDPELDEEEVELLEQGGLVEAQGSIDARLEALPPKAIPLIALAIQERAATLQTIAKKLGNIQGYPVQARQLGADADALTELILPHFQAGQVELLETDAVEVRAALSNQILQLLRRRRLQGPVADPETGLTDDNALQRTADALALAIFQFGEGMYQAGYATARVEGDANPTLWWNHVVDLFQPGGIPL